MDEADVPDQAPADGVEPEPSLEQLADDLAAVERAMERLEDGSYWSDEETGEALPDDLLAADPTARRIPPPEPDTAPR